MKMPQYNYCVQDAFSSPASITDFPFMKINDPVYFPYKGLVQTPWSSSSLHQFETSSYSIYIDPLTLNFKYEKPSASAQIGYSENGFVQATFTHADYANYESCPPSPYFLSEQVPLDLFEELKSKLFGFISLTSNL